MNSTEPIVPIAPVRREKGSERRRALRFALVLGVVFGGIGAWLLRSGPSRAGQGLVAGAVALIVYAIVHPAGALVLRAGWLRAGAAIGRVNSVILLSALYLVLVTPLGLLARVIGRRSLRPARKASYFAARQAPRDPKRFEHPY